eukprot:7569147-Alexandrium_andersonii.AAC.1
MAPPAAKGSEFLGHRRGGWRALAWARAFTQAYRVFRLLVNGLLAPSRVRPAADGAARPRSCT